MNPRYWYDYSGTLSPLGQQLWGAELDRAREVEPLWRVMMRELAKPDPYGLQ